MSELSLGMLLAVFEEMFGPVLFWALVVVAAAALVLFLWVLWRDRGVESRRFLRAQIAAPFGALAAIWFMFWITKSGLADIGGAIDVIALIAIGVAGAVGLTLLAYLGQALTGTRPDAVAAR